MKVTAAESCLDLACQPFVWATQVLIGIAGDSLFRIAILSKLYYADFELNLLCVQLVKVELHFFMHLKILPCQFLSAINLSYGAHLRTPGKEP